VSGSYRVEVRPAALKQLDRVHGPDRARILRRVQSLADNPRPAGVTKLAGSDDLWRIRVGDYRVVYIVVDEVLVVTVVAVGHRREVYRDF
jgi:mRNA interferase RelE/StbE